MKQSSAFYSTASQNLITIHHVKDLMTRLRKKGLEVLFFRGISLIGDVYPSFGERDMLDVDIIVKKGDLEEVAGILRGMALEEIESGSYCKAGFAVDVHTSFLNLSRTNLERSCLTISIDDVFRRSVIKELDGIEMRIPSPLHLFISTAIHLQSHSFFPKKGWEDLVRIKKYYGLADEDILTEAQKMGADKTLVHIGYLRPELFPYWWGKLSVAERWILKRIRAGTFNQNFGDLLFLFQSKKKGQALREIFFPRGFSLGIIGNRALKSIKLMKDALS